MNDEKIIGAVDIGAGIGAKLEIVRVKESNITVLGEELFHQRDYGNTAQSFSSGLTNSIRDLLCCIDIPIKSLSSIGIDIPGFLDADQNIIQAINLPFLDGSNIRSPIEEKLGVPVSIINDADSGALAEWSIHRKELVYWVLGGGWGGSWISKKGEIKFPTIVWNGKDEDIHISDEPGYRAEISKDKSNQIFNKYGSSTDKFLSNLAKELNIKVENIKGPNNNSETIRAEVFVSGKGLWRTFHGIIAESYLNDYSKEEQNALRNSDSAGAMISNLFLKGDPFAKLTFQLMGDFFKEISLSILSQIVKDGAPIDVPIFLGGGMANAFDWFVPQAQNAMRNSGFKSVIHQSHFLDSGRNANLIGAIWLAMKNSE